MVRKKLLLRFLMIPTSSNKKRAISVFMLAMINVSMMASLRNLPLVAEFGYSIVSFYILVSVLFLIPCALVSAELATGWPQSGGVYIWVKKAFGDRMGFFAIWMQWVHNVTWYPAMLSFVAATIAYVFFPTLADHKIYILFIILFGFWGMTLLNYLGIKTSALISTIGVIAGTIIPGICIILCGFYWFFTNKPTDLVLSGTALLPNLSNVSDFIFLAGLFLAFGGLEVSAGYASEVKNPTKNYPIAILLAAVITLLLIMFGALTIALVITKRDISLVSGVMNALQILLQSLRIVWMLPVLGILLVIGALAEVNSWIIGPIKALYVTSNYGDLPPYFQKQNKRGMPVNLLLFQGIIVTLFSFLFLYIPSISGTYWILTVVASQTYLVMYITMFAAAIRLRYSAPHVKRSYMVPGGKKGIWIIAGLGILSSSFALLIGFFPPPTINIGHPTFFWLFLLFILLLMMLFPIAIHHFKNPRWKRKGVKKIV